MEIVIQRVNFCRVVIYDDIYSQIDIGLLILLGIASGDTETEVNFLTRKIAGIRIFSDEHGKMNRSIIDIDGEIMVVSQFTLLANTRKGNRPSFIEAATPETAIPLYEYFVDQLKVNTGAKIATGKFGADMNLELENNGPVTICMSSKKEKNDH